MCGGVGVSGRSALFDIYASEVMASSTLIEQSQVDASKCLCLKYWLITCAHSQARYTVVCLCVCVCRLLQLLKDQ